MNSAGATALPVSPFKLFNGYEGYSKALAAGLALFSIPPQDDPDAKVYIPKPASMKAMYEDHLDKLFVQIRVSLNDLAGYEKRLGGFVVKTNDPATAHKILEALEKPTTVLINDSPHDFVATREVPKIHSGVRLRLVGLPIPFSSEHLNRLATMLAADPADLVFSEVLKSRGGVPTNKALLIYKVAPPFLLGKTSFTLGELKIMSYFLDRETRCENCQHSGHARDTCPAEVYEKLPEPEPEPEKGKEKEKTGDSSTPQQQPPSGQPLTTPPLGSLFRNVAVRKRPSKGGPG